MRRDSLGRKIGHNWWREMNTGLLFDATLLWENQREAEAVGYETEERAFEATNPRPNLKEFLEANRGFQKPE